MENRITQSAGFTLIELILTLVLVGIIGVFTSLFVYSGIRGYIITRQTSEGALQAQIAMDRISLELRNINYLTSAPDTTAPDLSVSYKSETLSGTRELKYDSTQNAILISVDNGSNYYKLLGNISSCNLLLTYLNLDHDTGPVNEVAHIDLNFTLDGIGQEFRTRIFPRYLVEEK
jgi:prepilin-type N-terminal cleavage/methylation domain-containing protein